MAAARPNNPPFPGRGPKRSRSPRRGSSKKKGCPFFLLAWVITGVLVAYGMWWLALAGGQLVAYGLTTAISIVGGEQ